MNHKLAQIFAQCAHQSASADNSQPWHFSWDDLDFIIYYDEQRVQKNTFPPLNPATLLAIGSCIDNIVQFAEKHHIPIQCRYVLTDNNDVFEFVRITVHGQAEILTNLTPPEVIRHTNRLNFKPTPIPQNMLSHIEAFSRGESRTVCLTQKSAIETISQQVYAASEIRFQTREVHEWLRKSLRFENDHTAFDGLDVKTLGLPPGGKLFLKVISDWKRMARLNKVGVYKILSSIDSAPVKKAPVLVGIIGTSNPQGALNSGQLLNAVWTELNFKGFAVHPYYVIPDLLYRLQENQIPKSLSSQANSIYSACKSLLPLSESETLHMLLRVGYPEKQPFPSRRLPLEVVFTDTTEFTN